MDNELAVRRLAYVKSLFLDARRTNELGSPVGSSLSLVILDNSLEHFLWAIINAKKPEIVGTLDTFTKVVRATKAIYDSLSNFADFDAGLIEQLHKARNTVQHNGVLLDKGQINDYFDLAARIFKLSNVFLDVDWDSVSMSLLIRDGKIRNLYETSEAHKEKNRLTDAVLYLTMAFEEAKNHWYYSFDVALIRADWTSLYHAFTRQKDGKPSEQLDQSQQIDLLIFLEKLNNAFGVQRLGIDYVSWYNFRIIFSDLDPVHSLDESTIRHALAKIAPEILERWWRNNYSFVTHTILRWQDSSPQQY